MSIDEQKEDTEAEALGLAEEKNIRDKKETQEGVQGKGFLPNDGLYG